MSMCSEQAKKILCHKRITGSDMKPHIFIKYVIFQGLSRLITVKRGIEKHLKNRGDFPFQHLFYEQLQRNKIQF